MYLRLCSPAGVKHGRELQKSDYTGPDRLAAQAATVTALLPPSAFVRRSSWPDRLAARKPLGDRGGAGGARRSWFHRPNRADRAHHVSYGAEHRPLVAAGSTGDLLR